MMKFQDLPKWTKNSALYRELEEDGEEYVEIDQRYLIDNIELDINIEDDLDFDDYFDENQIDNNRLKELLDDCVEKIDIVNFWNLDILPETISFFMFYIPSYVFVLFKYQNQSAFFDHIQFLRDTEPTVENAQEIYDRILEVEKLYGGSDGVFLDFFMGFHLTFYNSELLQYLYFNEMPKEYTWLYVKHAVKNEKPVKVALEGDYLIYYYCEVGNLDELYELIDNDSELDMYCAEIACENDNLELLKYLISVSHLDENALLPIFENCLKYNAHECLTYLLENMEDFLRDNIDSDELEIGKNATEEDIQRLIDSDLYIFNNLEWVSSQPCWKLIYDVCRKNGIFVLNNRCAGLNGRIHNVECLEYLNTLGFSTVEGDAFIINQNEKKSHAKRMLERKRIYVSIRF